MVFMYNDQRTIKDNQADYKIVSKNLQNSQIWMSFFSPSAETLLGLEISLLGDSNLVSSARTTTLGSDQPYL